MKEPEKRIVIDPRILKRIVHGALKSTNDAHGTITKELFGSVLKRCMSQLEVYTKDAVVRLDDL